MDKELLAAWLAKKYNLATDKSLLIVDEVFSYIAETLNSNKPVLIKDFGNFKLIKRKGMNTWNSRGVLCEMKDKIVIHFAASPKLLTEINKGRK